MLFARVPLEFKHPPPPDWDGALGCDSAVEENGYPLGSDSSVSTLFAVRVCGLATALWCIAGFSADAAASSVAVAPLPREKRLIRSLASCWFERLFAIASV